MSTIEILFILTILALAPILIMMTCFTRLLSYCLFCGAPATQTTPPNQVFIDWLYFLLYIMAPVGSEINQKAIQPYLSEEISQETALENAMEPIRNFMFKYTREKDLALFLEISESENRKTGGYSIEIIDTGFYYQ